MSWAALSNPAGGLRYHLRAWRHSEKLWSDFRWPLGEWLLRWHTSEPCLVLVGPSAGYNLQPFLLERFQRVVVLEPDPLARWLLRRRLSRVPLEPRPRLEFVTEDQLVFHPERFGPFLESLGPSAVLFCNVLGQLGQLLGVADTEAPALARVRAAVQSAIAGRSWASFHDRVSGAIAPSLEQAVLSERRWSDAELFEHAFYGSGEGLGVSLRDHGVRGFFPEHLEHLYLSWQLEPGAFHLIEAVAPPPPGASAGPGGD